MLLGFRALIWRTRDRVRRLVRLGAALLVVLLRLGAFAALAAGGAQALASIAAAWADSMLESDLGHVLGPHQTTAAMEAGIRSLVRARIGAEPSHVRVEVRCPAPGPPGPLESIGPTCLLAGEVRYERNVLLLTRTVQLSPSEKVFRDSFPGR